MKRDRSPLGGNASDTDCCSHVDLLEPRLWIVSGLPTIRELKVRIPLAQVVRRGRIYRDGFHQRQSEVQQTTSA